MTISRLLNRIFQTLSKSISYGTSEALALLKQVLPDRVDDFKSHYEYPRVRKEINSQNYMVRDYLQGLEITNDYEEVIVDGSAAFPEFEQQLVILKSAKLTFASSLFDIRTILQADLFDTEIDSAQAFLKAGFIRPAGAICGVVIEKHLKQVCENHKLSIRKKTPHDKRLQRYFEIRKCD